jgi:mono/diheme cytochrome c family protein
LALTSIGASSISNGHSVRSALIIAWLFALAGAAPAHPRQAGAADLTSGDAIYRAGCAGCHGPNGEGAPDTTVGFDKPATFPNFTQCDTTTPELDVDWKATIRDGGRGRGFSRIMPAFGDQLTSSQIDAVIKHVRGLCRDPSWPRGELNLPRPLTTEKAFPEDETVITTAVGAHHAPDVTHNIVYEHRYGARNQIEVSIPLASLHDSTGTVARGVGDVGVGLKRVLFAGSHAIVSAQGEVVLPTGNSDKGLGTGVTVFEAFAAYGQILPAHLFFQGQAGTEQPTDTQKAPRAVFGRAALGTSFRQERGVGRMWSPMLELITDRDLEDGARTNVDLMPQMQVTLNRRQHLRVNVGLQLPVANRAGRSKQVVFYFLWDWFDGGLLDGWK